MVKAPKAAATTAKQASPPPEKIRGVDPPRLSLWVLTFFLLKNFAKRDLFALTLENRQGQRKKPMGSIKTTGPTGDDTVEQIKAAIVAAPGPDGASATSTIPSCPMPAEKGEAGYRTLIEFAEGLIEDGHVLSDVNVWKQAGLRGFGQFTQMLSGHAMAAAQEAYAQALSKSSFTATPDTLDRHPAFDYERAAGWLFKTSHKLFSDRAYARLGGSAQAFYAGMRDAYCDLVYQAVRTADAMLDADPEDARALDLIELVWGKCFDRLGVQEIDDHVTNKTGISAGEIDAVEYRAVCAKMRTLLHEAADMRWRARDSDAYFTKILDAWEVLRHDESILEDHAAFDGLNVTPSRFVVEAQRAVETLIERNLRALEDGNREIPELYGFIERVQHWRTLFDEVDAPDNVKPEHEGEDFWCAEILDQFGYRSYTHMIQCLHASYGGARANIALNNRRNEDPANLYDALMEARDSLMQGDIPFDRPGGFEGLALDREAFFSTLDETAPAAISRDWMYVHHIGMPAQDRLKILDNIADAFDRIRATDYTDWTNVTPRMVHGPHDKTRLRVVAEILALSQAALDTDGVYTVMKPAVDLLDDMKLDMKSTRFHDAAGMSAARAEELFERFDRADMGMLWRAATSDEEDDLQRLVYAMEFSQRFEDMTNGKAAEALEMLFTLTGSWEDYQGQLGIIATDARNAAVERMEAAPNDTLGNAQLIRSFRNAVTFISPDTLQFPMKFRHLTGLSLAQFLAQEKEIQDKVAQLISPPGKVFFITPEDAGKRLARIAKMQPGEEGWYALRQLRHDATVTGFSLADDRVLNAARLNWDDLADLNCVHALQAARACLDAARQGMEDPLTLSNREAHPYHHFVRARRWIGRSGYGMLLDEPYREIGFDTRAHFTQAMREALFDYAVQLEGAVLREGVAGAGGYKYITALEETRNVYQELGFDCERDDAATDIPAELMPNTVNVAAVRNALQWAGPSVSLSVLDSDLSLSAKYRRMHKLMDFAKRMNVVTGTHPKTAAISSKFSILVNDRLARVIDNFAKNPDDMARGWRVACAIGEVCDRYNLTTIDWFNPLFQRLGYGNFDAFCHDMAIKRLNQLHRRCVAQLQNAGADQFGSAAFHRGIAVDIGRMQAILESPMLDDDRVSTIMSHAGVNREWMTYTHRISAALSLPLLADIAYEPTMRSEERYELLEDMFGLREVAGRKDHTVRRLNWDELAVMKREMVLMRATQHLLKDMMRGENPTWSPRLLQVYALMEEAGMSMSDPAHLQQLGLNAQESALYAGIGKLSFPYSMILRLEHADPRNVNEVHSMVLGLYRYAEQNNIDLIDPSVHRALGLRDRGEVMRLLIGPAVHMARIFSNTLKTTQDPVQGREVGKLMQHFMEATRLEKRIDRRILEAEGVLDRITVGQMIGNFGRMLKKARIKSEAALQPAGL